MMGSSGPMEPSADMREAANHLRQIFVALIAEGFEQDQALKIIGHILASNRGDS